MKITLKYTYQFYTEKGINWSDAVDLDGDHCIKSVKDLRYNFEQAGITADKEIIAYCQSGVRSMHTTYVLTEILGYPKVKNYDGSWIEWSYFHTQDQSVEVERHTSVEHYEQLTIALEEKLEQEKKSFFDKFRGDK